MQKGKDMTKVDRNKRKKKLKRSKSGIRPPPIPPNKRHKTKKQYKRENKVKVHEVEE